MRGVVGGPAVWPLLLLLALAAFVASLAAPQHPAKFRQASRSPLHDRPLVVSVDDLRGLRAVAHNVNALGPLRDAVARGAAVVEVDVIVVHGRLFARHDPVPSSVGLNVPSPRLAEVWELLPEGTAVHLDLKSRGSGAVKAVVAFLASHPGRAVTITTPDRRTLRALSDAGVDAALLLSVRDPAELARLAEEPGFLASVDGVTIREDLLDGATVSWLLDGGSRIVAWTVDDPERARELAALGVTEVTTDSLALIEALATPPTVTGIDGGGSADGSDGAGDGGVATPLACVVCG